MRRRVVLGVVVWALGVVVWAVQPLVDHVPTGLVDGSPTAQAVECHAPLSFDDAPAEPLPVLEPPRAYERDACASPHEQARWILAVNVVAALGLGVGALVLRARRRPPATAEAAPAPEASPQLD